MGGENDGSKRCNIDQDKHLKITDQFRSSYDVNNESGIQKTPGPSASKFTTIKNLFKSGDIKIIHSVDDVRQVGLFNQDSTVKDEDNIVILNKILDDLAKVEKERLQKEIDNAAIASVGQTKADTSNHLIHKIKTILHHEGPSTSKVNKRKRSRSSGSPRKKAKHETRSSFFYYGKLSDLIFKTRSRGQDSLSDSDSDNSSS